MGLTKQYLQYDQIENFGLIGSLQSRVTFINHNSTTDRYCVLVACQDVNIWDTRTNEKVRTLKGEKSKVTCTAVSTPLIGQSTGLVNLAVGYADGAIKLFQGAECVTEFAGHRSPITTLSFSNNNLMMVSGSEDTDVVVWDLVNECGLYRFKGHKGPITKAEFAYDDKWVVSSSKDSFIKFWDVNNQHCAYTLVGHRTEVYDFVLLKDGKRLLTGSSDNELRIWDVDIGDEIICTKVGTLNRHGKERVMSLKIDEEETLLLCHGNDSLLEIFRILSEEDLEKLKKKRKKKIKKKDKDTDVSDSVLLSITDEFHREAPIKFDNNILSIDMCSVTDSRINIAALFTNNTLETFNIQAKATEPQDRKKLMSHGHPTDVRTLCFSSDNTCFLTASAEMVKLWNKASVQCIRTMKSEYAVSSLFAPGDRHIIIGTKSGKIQLFDVSSGSLTGSVDAHEGAVWSLSMTPDKRGVASGGADKKVNFWNFELVQDEGKDTRSLNLVHTKSLHMDEDVLCVRYSGDGRFIAVALLDNTVKVFFTDTLKFFLSLYGHKLPVLSLDISTDSTLVVTGSADRNVKIWGLDFGDCHKSLFAHYDSVMCVQFLPKTHLFFTAGKDGKIKQWDADIFQHILTLQGHQAEIWCIAISPNAKHLLSASHDRSIRLWEKTSEVVVLQDEKEMEREKEYEMSLLGDPKDKPSEGEGADDVGLASQRTLTSLKGTERIIESIDIFKEEKAQFKQLKQVPASKLHPMFIALGTDTPVSFMSESLKKIRSSDLEESLLMMPFKYVSDLLEVLEELISNGIQIELCCRCLFFLTKVHQGQISSSSALQNVVDRLRVTARKRISDIRDSMGFNLSGLQFLKRNIESSEDVKLFADYSNQVKKKKK